MKRSLTTKEMTYSGLFAVMIGVCAMISINTTVPFTMQTFGVSLALILLGGRCGGWSVAVYILMGAVGLPVFSGGVGGLGKLFGMTGGYILGFIFMAMIYLFAEKKFSDKKCWSVAALLVGTWVCYLFGTVWFVYLYSKNAGAIGFWTGFTMCVAPYIVPDLVKLGGAVAVGKVLKKHIKL